MLALATPALAQVEMSPEPYHIRSLGLSFHLPIGAHAQTSQMSGQVSVSILPSDSTWRLTIQTPRTRDPDLTPKAVVARVVQELLDSVAIQGPDLKQIKTAGRVIERTDDLVIGSTAASRAYVLLPRGPDRPSLVRGFTAFQVEPGRFVTFDLMTAQPEFERARPIYEAVVGTARFEDPGRLATARAAAVRAGLTLLQGLNRSDFEAIVTANPDRWERLYATDPTSGEDSEFGYRRIRTSLARRGELDPRKPRSRWTASDQTEGYMVRIDARFLAKDLTTDTYEVFDSSGSFFLSVDRSEESWILKTTSRGRGGPATWTEVGARITNKAGQVSLSVTTTGPGSAPQTIRPLVQGEGYISRVEAYLLPQILVRSGIAADYGFYVYQSSEQVGAVRLRRDALEQPQDMPGVWRLTTRLSEDTPEQVSLLQSSGQLIRTTLADGRVWEPVTPERLLQIWKAAHLPVD